MDTKGYNPIMAGMAYAVANILIKVLPFITLPVFTHILTPVDFGIYNTYLSYENILSIVIGLGITGTIRVAKIDYPSTFEEYISSLYGIVGVSGVIFGLLIFAGYELFFGSQGGWITSGILAVLILHSICMQIFCIATAKYAIIGDVKNNIELSVIITILNVAISLVLCLFVMTDVPYLGRILGTFFAALIVACVATAKQLAQHWKLFQKRYWAFAMELGTPLILHQLSITLLANCDKIMIQRIVGDAETGIYSIAVTITLALGVLVASMDDSWAPWFYDKIKKHRYQTIKKYNTLMIYFFASIVAIVILISPELIKMVSAKEYWDAIYIFPTLAASVFFNFVYIIPVNFEYTQKNTRFISISTIITAIINVILNYICIKLIGYIGVAYATMISKIILLMMHLNKVQELEDIDLFEKKGVLLCGVGIIVLSPFILFTAKIWLLRYLLAMFIFIGCYIWIRKTGTLDIIKEAIYLRKV